MLFDKLPKPQSPARAAITAAYRMDEATCVETLLDKATLPKETMQSIEKTAYDLVAKVRAKGVGKTGIDAFLFQYSLSSEEGIALMCLAESLLRIPDEATRDKLIKDKVTSADWQAHSGKSSSLFVNAATWGLMLTGKVYSWNALTSSNLNDILKRLAKRGGEPLIRKAVAYIMEVLGKQFVMGETITKALKRAREQEKIGYRYSYDMLGEAACTEQDALRYYEDYQHAIKTIGSVANNAGFIAGPGISVKLSALFPRYELSQAECVYKTLVPRLLNLAVMAKEYNISLTVDAEEADRLELSLDVIEQVFANPALDGWEGFGLAVQSYQKRAIPVIHWLADLATRVKRRLMIRLIKGAYWDSEIKRSQMDGLEGYPVFTRKQNTDVSFLACAKEILQFPQAFYPMFATHNAYSVAAILHIIGDRKDYEFQCLHGMGKPLYDEIVPQDKLGIPCRIYAPVGGYQDLLAYLVRRLLENGANSSFVNRIVDERQPIEDLIQSPVTVVSGFAEKSHPQIPLPKNIYGSTRENSMGFDISNIQSLTKLANEMQQACKDKWQAGPVINGVLSTESPVAVSNPHNTKEIVGYAMEATNNQVEAALSASYAAREAWSLVAVDERSNCLLRMANLLEENRAKLMAMAVKEAGKNIADAIAEVREAVDFCRYYAKEAQRVLANPEELTGATGELNQYSLHGRGVIVCISPWNFPLAIFIGQVTAALVAGNCVIAKPAEQTPIIATYAVQLLHQAGIPKEVLQLLPGRGEIVGAKLVADLRIAGVMFTGSTQTARLINQTLANRQGPIIPFIAETGGMNAMIVDSTALPEQVVKDVIQSAFGSAGQRCSALRVLFLQKDSAPRILQMLAGAMAEIRVGDPSVLTTDVGPVIDQDALKMLQDHFAYMSKVAKPLYQVALNEGTAAGTYFAPCAFEIANINLLKQEIFGPFLHIIQYDGNQLDEVINTINNTGYGLTLGIHSRINETADYIISRARVGNIYVNRNMIGAVVGVQPFGGEGLSGTGPKAGGPNYLQRLCNERSLSVNTTAAGGNASLMSLD